MTNEVLVWGGYDIGSGPSHPTTPLDPAGEPWGAATLSDSANTALARVWFYAVHTTVVAEFSFEDALNGTSDDAVLPLLMDGFFGDDGHTLGYYRNRDQFSDVNVTNLRTRSSWMSSWDSMDERVAEMKASPDYVPRAMR